MNCQLKRSVPVLAALLTLAACGDTNKEPDATETPAAQAGEMSAMGGTAAASAPIKAKSTGTITALDKAAGRITLDHAAIPEAEWPAMTMGFNADPAILGDVEVGDKVTFDIEIAGSTGTVTAITKE
jgi:Cu(I)/Ag(I) efflux system periplasmic protein CusF